MIRIRVLGRPAPQGSKNAWGQEASKHVKPWRVDVKAAAIQACGEAPLNGPIQCDLLFFMQRPKAHYVASNPERELKDTAPVWFDKMPDIDKLERSTFDALKGVAWIDDCQVCAGRRAAIYADDRPGALILIRKVEDQDLVNTLEHFFPPLQQ